MTLLASDFIDPSLLERLAYVTELAERYRPATPFTQWLTEFRTFSLGLGRQTGKTSTLMRYTDEHTMLIVPNQRMAEYITKQYPHQLRQVFTPYSLLQFATYDGRGTDRQISRIFMDELSMVGHKEWDSVYEAIELLNAHRHLTPTVFVLKVGTPVR